MKEATKGYLLVGGAVVLAINWFVGNDTAIGGIGAVALVAAAIWICREAGWSRAGDREDEKLDREQRDREAAFEANRDPPGPGDDA